MNRGADSTCRSFAAALSAGRVEAAAGCFLSGGCLIAPGATAVRGREDICLVLIQLVALGARVDVESAGLFEVGEIALVHQRWEIALSPPEGDALVESTTPTFVLRRVGSEWKLAIAAPFGMGEGPMSKGDGRTARRLRSGIAGTLTLLAFLAASAPATATYNPLAGGTTRLAFAKPFLGALRQNGVKLAADGGAELRHGTATFPVSGGKFDPTTANGFIEHAGSLFFKAGRREVPLTSLQLKTSQRHAPFSAKFGGGQLKVASTPKLTVTRAGFADKVVVSTLALSSKVATRLNKKLRLRGVFKAGQLFGSSVSVANPQTVAISEAGKAEFVFDPAIAAKLQSLFVAINPIFPAEHPGPFTLPIFTGTISTTASEGTVQTLGAIELVQIGGGQVFLREAWVELGGGAYAPELELTPSPPYAGKLGRSPVGALSLAGAAVSADPVARTIGVTNATVSLGANLAAAFNDAFAKPLGRGEVFHAGEALGSVGFVAVGE